MECQLHLVVEKLNKTHIKHKYIQIKLLSRELKQQFPSPAISPVIASPGAEMSSLQRGGGLLSFPKVIMHLIGSDSERHGGIYLFVCWYLAY